ncbi:MAG: translation initiation factor IF-2 [Legionellales bacterium]|nr:translation initiation factor IF-2 [Legionellales bacterium]
MSTITVDMLAKKSGLTTQDLLKKITEAGLPMSKGDHTLSIEQQKQVLEHIRSKKKKIDLKLKKPLSLKKKSPTETMPAASSQHNRNLDRPDNTAPQTTSTTSPKNKKHQSPTKTPRASQPDEHIKPLSVEEVLASRAKKNTNRSAEQSGKTALSKTKEPTEKHDSIIELNETMQVDELASKLNKSTTEIIKIFFDLGEMITINQIIPYDLAEIVCDQMGYTSQLKVKQTLEDEIAELTRQEDETQDIQPRSAIVTIMGHVDHGKTTLLDTIRKTKIADKEAGGITQHIGAYKVETSHGDITFLDTPGHESFTAMRARGAKVTDIVVLVVAANDGVMPQTIEAIQHAKAAEVPIIVAVNKIDKEDADIDKIKTDLSQHNLSPEDWGGDTIFQNISAKTGQGIDELLDSIALQAELLELKANYAGAPRGIIIESRVDMGLGPIATILIQSGQLRSGDIVLINEFYGKIRAMYDHTRKRKTVAHPSDTVEITGLSGLPRAGDHAIGVSSEREARLIAARRKNENRLKERLAAQQSKDDLFLKQMDDQMAQLKELSIIIKADVHGSLEAILDIVNKINSNPEIETLRVKVIAHTVGGINSSDIHLAGASNALIVAFNVRADASAKKLQAQEKTQIEYFSTVYDIYDYLLQLTKDIMKPETTEKILGSADVKEVFRTSKQITISGCIVTEGAIRKNANVRLLRDHKVIYSGKIQSLRRFQDEATEVKKGLECGIGIKGYTDVQSGDVIETFVIEKNN